MAKKKRRQNKSPDLENILYKYFKNSPRKQFSRKQLLKKFSNKFSREEILSALDNLLENNRIYLTSQKRFRFKAPRQKTNEGIYEGTVELTDRGFGFVLVENLKKDIFVSARKMGMAMTGDRVKVRLIQRQGRRPEGEVIEIIHHAQTQFIGTLFKSARYARVIPDHDRVPFDISVSPEEVKDIDHGEKVLVEVTRWYDDGRMPHGKILETLGHAGISDVEMKSILLENGFPLNFSGNCLKEAESIPDRIDEEEIKRRKDLRDVLTFTIDPVDAKDFDDALSIRKTGPDRWEIGVHIADVSHYVRENTALDREAFERATSVYLVDRVLPMFPERLSNGICSLRPGEDKLCFSVMFMMDEKAHIHEYEFTKTIIHSNNRFTYEEVQAIIESKEGLYCNEILLLDKIAKILRKERINNGSIDFHTEEVRFELDEHGKPLSVYVKESKDAHKLIEEFMLLANKTVATFISKLRKGRQAIPFPYRIHDVPDSAKLEVFLLFARKFGHVLKFSSPDEIPAALNDLMQKIHGRKEEHILSQLAIRTMAKAEYSTKNIGHYGLGFPYYCHFTSPIRRYPDVIAHRILFDIIQNDRTDRIRAVIEEQCKHASVMERKAVQAERESVKYKQVEYMLNHVGESFDGIISGVTYFGFFVELVDNKCEGLVHIDSLQDDEYVFSDSELSLTGLTTGNKFQFGDEVRVKVISADLERREITFVLDEPEAQE